jgi:ketosteroid isomerase-like protein
MNQQNLQLVQRAYESADRFQFDAFLDALADDVTWSFVGPAGEAPFFGEFHGRGELMQALRPYLELCETRQLQPRRFVADGDTVIVLEHEEIKVRRTGRTCELDCAHVITIRDGRIATLKQIGDTATLLQTLRA